MEINWSVLATIASPIIALFIGVAVDKLIERRATIIAYFTHAAAFNLAGANPITVHTHGIVIKNVGKRTAADIRVRHTILPENFNVFPNIQYRVESLPMGGTEIVFPALVPNEQVTISYLYLPPLLFSQIHAGIRHSEGFATEVRALPAPRYPAWIRRIVLLLLILGIIAFIYLLREGLVFLHSLSVLLKK
ncbi:MAG: hypothetical protein WC532_00750 [Candidatus Omnitrophota bacterium]